MCAASEKTFDNAEKLYFEAELLAKAGATARALCLHQISLEECSYDHCGRRFPTSFAVATRN
ncbi:AbiV family abortive infection protein [Bradyrhizobium japonicum]|uniref:AbiV family abortive infection protein n=1 Tax=Bradyrhizobium TaxID=374 RepID=UPI0009B681C1|nr:AbiV family abortive infection protein [Bradyrhizobium liaoningense]